MGRIVLFLPALISVLLLVAGRRRPGLTPTGRFGAWLWLFGALLLTRYGPPPLLVLGLLAQVGVAVYIAVKLRFLG